jgi:signal peptide peptidase SppA
MASQNKLIRIMTALVCEPWLLTPQMHRTLTDIARAHSECGDAEAAQHAAAAQMKANPKKREYSLVDRTAIIPCEGVIGRKFDSVLYSSGVTSINIFQRLVETAAGDNEVDSLLLLFDSPGGLVTGTPEAAQAVARAREVKPVVAYADGLCDSAAYWIASQADVIYATPSADVGSIGCYLAVLDQSRAMEMEGIRTELFKSGKHKGMGYPGTSLNDEQRAMLQASVDKIAGQFKAAVNSGRGRLISDEAMQGQSFSVEDAKRIGLIDEVTDMDQALRDAVLLKNTRKGDR